MIDLVTTDLEHSSKNGVGGIFSKAKAATTSPRLQEMWLQNGDRKESTQAGSPSSECEMGREQSRSGFYPLLSSRSEPES